MPSCVAVTRGGWGDIWGFDSPEDARRHPLIQEGDAVVSEPEDVVENWNYLFLPRMCLEVLGEKELSESLRDALSTDDPRTRASRASVGGQEVWDILLRVARKPPTDDSEIIRLIREDRRLYDEWHQREQTRRSSVTQAQAATATAEQPKEKKIAGHVPTAKIAFGKDKDGKSYNTTDNNPKRAGSKSGERFAKYKAGMTLEAAVEAGVSPADIKWDSDHGFITIG